MAEFKTRITKVTVTPGELFHERGFEVEIVDESGGEFIQVRSNDTGGCLRFDVEEWPALCVAIDDMVRGIKENEEKPEPPEEGDDGWLSWNGGECPVSETVFVKYKLFSGLEAVDRAGRLRWEHLFFEGTDGSSNIIAYKVVD